MKNRLVPLAFAVAGFALGFLPVSGRAQTSLFSDTFDTDTSANWSVFEGSGNGIPDATVLFGFDYSTNKFTRNGVTATIPPAPNGGGKGVKMYVNKNDDIAATAAVSIYPKNKTFSGSYAFKFDMWLNYNGEAGGGTGSTEFATFGINHTGDKVNWENSGFTSDGTWFAVTGETGAAYDYRSYVGDNLGPALKYGGAAGGFLDRDGDGVYEDEAYYGQDPALYPLAVMFPQPQFETTGMPSKQWVQVEVRQRTNETGAHVVTWLINNYVIAEHQNGETLGVISGNVMLGNMDIFSSIASPKEDNYVIYDNARVVDLTGVAPLPIVTVVTNDATAAEPADPGSYTLTRYGNLSQPLTVNYKMIGSASNGVDYATLPGSVTIPANQSSVDVALVPINDRLGEALETATLVLVGSTNYDLYTNIFATVTLADDNDVPVATLSTTKTNTYEMNPDAPGRFVVDLSNPSSTPTTVNLQVGGTAVAGTDYVAVPTSVTIPAGGTNALVAVRPINNGVANAGVRTVTLTVLAGTGYDLGATTNGTVTIRDDDFLPSGTLVYSENFETDHTANWVVNTPASGDYPTDLFFDYSSVGVPPAPNSTGGTTHGAKLQANLTSGVFGGVSISPASLDVTGDYMLRFDLWQNFNGPLPDGGSGSTQISGGGIGSKGVTVQWPGGTQDSVWFATTGDGGSSIDYRAHSSAAPTGYTDDSGVFAAGTTGSPRNNANPYYYEFGNVSAPQSQLDNYPNQKGTSFAGSQAFQWHDVAIVKQANTVRWYIDGKIIATVNANATNFAGGNIVLLHSDINLGSSTDINAPAMAFGLFDNVRVYQLASQVTAPNIGGIKIVDANVEIDFTGAASDTPADFKVFSSGSAATGYAETPATITSLGGANFRAVLPKNGEQQFYKIRR